MTPPRSAAGRGGAIRLVSNRFDILVVGLYLAPLTHSTTKAMVNKTNDIMLKWAAKVIEEAPARCLPDVCMDGNTKLGMIDGGYDPTDTVGFVEPEEPNETGQKIWATMNKLNMMAVNTFYSEGP